MIQLLSDILILSGAIFMFIAAIGVMKYKDIFLQLHCAAKVGSLSASLILLGVGMNIKNYRAITEIFLLILFIGITNPISSHLIAKVAKTNHTK